MPLRAQIPNLFTLSNLICGTLSIYFSTQNQLFEAGVLIVIAALFDVFDGLIARALKVSGELGKQLDSLADVVSFGVGPVFLALSLNGIFQEDLNFGFNTVWLFIPVLMGPFSAYRLAKFNIDERQSTGFRGLPTPANAIFWVGVSLSGVGGLMDSQGLEAFFDLFTSSTTAVGVVSLTMSLLLVSDVPLMALKFKGSQWKENWRKYVLILSGLFLFLILGFSSIPIILLLYFLLSISIK